MIGCLSGSQSYAFAKKIAKTGKASVDRREKGAPLPNKRSRRKTQLIMPSDRPSSVQTNANHHYRKHSSQWRNAKRMSILFEHMMQTDRQRKLWSSCAKNGGKHSMHAQEPSCVWAHLFRDVQSLGEGICVALDQLVRRFDIRRLERWLTDLSTRKLPEKNFRHNHRWGHRKLNVTYQIGENNYISHIKLKRTIVNETIKDLRYMYQFYTYEHIPETNIKIIELGILHLVQQVSTDNLKTLIWHWRWSQMNNSCHSIRHDL